MKGNESNKFDFSSLKQKKKQKMLNNIVVLNSLQVRYNMESILKYIYHMDVF